MCALLTGVPMCALPILSRARLHRDDRRAALHRGAVRRAGAVADRAARPALRARLHWAAVAHYSDHVAGMADEEQLSVAVRGGMGDADRVRRRAPRQQLRSRRVALLDRQFDDRRSEEHTSELQSLMRNSYAVFCLKKKTSSTKPNKTLTAHADCATD